MSISFSTIIPARNEEKYLPGCLEALRASAEVADCDLEVIVVVNRSTDKTEQIARDAGCIVVHAEEKNLSIIRNAGVSKASNQYVITIDADSKVYPGMFTDLLRELSDEGVVGGGVMMYPDRYSAGIVLTGIMLLPIVFWHGISGGLFFFRKEDFEAISGFDESLVSVEDIDFAKRLRDHGKLSGRKFKTLWHSYIITSTRKFDRFGDWYFLLRPWLLWRLFGGKDKKAANLVWYDFER